MKNIIIFGGAGFIGTNLTKYLLDKGNKILCVDNFFTGKLNNINQFLKNQNYLYMNADITDGQTFVDLEDIIESYFYNFIDEIYNLACPASPPKYQIDPIYTIHTSIAVENVCKLAIKYDSKMLHTSTSEVYGDPDNKHHPQKESYRGNVNTMGPRACYDEGKRIAETIIYEYIKLGCRAKIIRIFNTYGPYMDPNDGRVISNFICQALNNLPFTIYGSGNQSRSFQYITDLINGMELVMKTDDDINGPINIGSPYEFTMNELIDMIRELIPESKSKIIYKELPQDDPTQRQADITYINKLTNYKPKVELKEGLINTINYFKNHYKEYENVL